MALLDSITQAKKQGANSQDIINEIIKQNPDKKAVFDQALKMGANHDAILNEVIKQNGGQVEQPSQVQKPSFLEKVGGFAKKVGGFIAKSEVGLGQDIAGAVVPHTQDFQEMEKSRQGLSDMQSKVLDLIHQKKLKGEDTSHLIKTLQDTGFDLNDTNINPALGKSNKQIIGDILGTTVDLLSAGTFGIGAKGAKSGQLLVKGGGAIEGLAAKVGLPTSEKIATPAVSGIIKGVLSGAKSGAITGSVFGGGQGFSRALQEDKSLGQAGFEGAIGGIGGGITGGILGGISGGISGGIERKNIRQEILKAQEEAGLRPNISSTIQEKMKTDKTFSVLVNEAQKQGYSNKDINFLSTVSPKDKPVMKKMFDLTVEAQNNPRQIVRAADVLGENATNIVKQVQTQNSIAGKMVDETAQALKGEWVDATPVQNKALDFLSKAGVVANEDGTPNWSKSVFNKTPELKNKIMQALSDLPTGTTDAYDLHQFKKSIDEVVDYGVSGEGLKGTASRLLKGVRNMADTVLDDNFQYYNTANTEFKLTRDFIDQVKEVVGKKVDFSTSQGSQAFGQAFRSAFSNNKSRPITLKLIEDLGIIAKQRGLKGADMNLLDQALYVNLLEDTFGSQAATGLSGEVSKALKTTSGVVSGIRHPIKGALNVVAGLVEKSQNITPEAKKNLLKLFIR